MAAVRKNLTGETNGTFNGIFAGEDFAIQDTINKGDGTAQDIAGWSLRFRIYEALGQNLPPLLEKTTAAGGIVLTDPTHGLCTITGVEADTQDIAPGYYPYTLWRVDSGATNELSYGLIQIGPND